MADPTTSKNGILVFDASGEVQAGPLCVKTILIISDTVAAGTAQLTDSSGTNLFAALFVANNSQTQINFGGEGKWFQNGIGTGTLSNVAEVVVFLA